MTKFSLILCILSAFILSACGGGAPVTESNTTTNTGGGTNTDTDTDVNVPGEETDSTLTNSTFYPLQYFQQGTEYFDEPEKSNNRFAGIGFANLIRGYVIAPVNSTTLEPLATPSIDDYSITSDGQPIDRLEQQPIMQKILGLPTTLNTAIIIDISSNGVVGLGQTQVDALIDEIKNYITTAQADSDPTIANQMFTLWRVATDATADVALFTNDSAELFTALDAIASDWLASATLQNSPLYESIVRAVGTYKGSGSANSSEIDLRADAINDLVDGYSMSNIAPFSQTFTSLVVSSVILISPGKNNINKFNAETANAALTWQSFLVFDEATDGVDTTDGNTTPEEDTATPDGMNLLGKPMFYVALTSSANPIDENLKAMSELVIENPADSAFDFAQSLIDGQKAAIQKRLKTDNRYLVRYILTEREGDHEYIFSSNATGYNYGLTTNFSASDDYTAVPRPEPIVEITGANDEFLAASKASVSEITKLYPATRWSALIFEPGDYTWAIDGVPATANADGSLDIDASTVGKRVTLINSSLSSGTNSAALDIVD
ncbi:MAG: hypothetical protein P1U57_00885 [Oleibacter sp.]|nr:hypothetical protein [Thalassolituus sp.]